MDTAVRKAALAVSLEAVDRHRLDVAESSYRDQQIGRLKPVSRTRFLTRTKRPS